MRRKQKISFKFVYYIYLNILIGLSVIAVVYVWLLLGSYEKSQPEKRVEEQLNILKEAADDGTLWDEYDFPHVLSNEFEPIDIKEKYSDAIASGDVEYALKPGTYSETSLVYNVTSDGKTIAEITLESVGEPVTRLAVFTIQEWEVSNTTIVAETKDYRITAPSDFSVSVNDVLLTDDHGDVQNDGTILYTAVGLFYEPKIEILDQNGVPASFKKSGTRIKTEFYDYSLTIPASISVTVNGKPHIGNVTEDGLVRHEIRTTQNPDVKISDVFGNTVVFEGGNHLPLTYCNIKAYDNYKVTVDGAEIPGSVKTITESEEFEYFKAYTTGLPKIATYEIAILRNDAVISIVDPNGNSVEWDKNLHTLDLTEIKSGASLPGDLASAVDVLGIAKKWSLFMTADLEGNNYGFWNIAQHLINGSYLYDVAFKWATNIDITFTSIHYLKNPPFTNVFMENFEWLTDTCFAIDVGLDKNMVVAGEHMIDTMHSTLTFVKHEGVWKLIQIKEIVE